MDAIFDLMGYVAVFYIAFHLGKHWALLKVSQSIVEHPENMQQVLTRLAEITAEEAESAPDGAVMMRVEQVGSVLYAYARDTGEFLAQAPDMTLLTQRVSERFPHKKFFGEMITDNSAKTVATK
jgi:hypothetical protein